MSEEHPFQIWCLYLSYKEIYDQKTASMLFLEIYDVLHYMNDDASQMKVYNNEVLKKALYVTVNFCHHHILWLSGKVAVYHRIIVKTDFVLSHYSTVVGINKVWGFLPKNPTKNSAKYLLSDSKTALFRPKNVSTLNLCIELL